MYHFLGIVFGQMLKDFYGLNRIDWRFRQLVSNVAGQACGGTVKTFFPKYVRDDFFLQDVNGQFL